MTKEHLYEVLSDISETHIKEAREYQKPTRVWLRWCAAAACLCLVVGAFAVFKLSQPNTLQTWHEGYKAKDYFKFSQVMGESETDFYFAEPFDATRYFSDQREKFEEQGILPLIQTHPQFTFAVHYNDDGSLYSVELWWARRGNGLKDYSDLKVVAGYEEIKIIKDCIDVTVDEKGNVLEPAVTVTERDGIRIVACGTKNTEKTLTFQNKNGWYQISGSWNDDYASVVALLDWFWDHPIDFEDYPLDAGDEYTYTTLSETPDAFADYLPDFSAFGFIEETTNVSLKNGVPVHFEGHYVAGVSEELVKTSDYHDQEGFTKIHWCILAEPDVYDLEGCMGDIHTLSREKIAHALKNENGRLSFMQEQLLTIVYFDDADQVWNLIESLINKKTQ